LNICDVCLFKLSFIPCPCSFSPKASICISLICLISPEDRSVTFSMDDYNYYKQSLEDELTSLTNILQNAEESLGVDRAILLDSANDSIKTATQHYISLRNSALTQQEKTTLQNEISDYDKRIDQFKKDIRAIAENSERVNRKGLEPKDVTAQVKYREALNSETDSTVNVLHGNIKHIKDIHMDAFGLKEQGQGINDNLNRQTSQIFNFSDQIRIMDGKITDARQNLNTLWAQMTKTQIVRLTIIGVLILACFLIIYVKFIYTPVVKVIIIPPPVNSTVQQ